jgi:hypothetical protein
MDAYKIEYNAGGKDALKDYDGPRSTAIVELPDNPVQFSKELEKACEALKADYEAFRLWGMVYLGHVANYDFIHLTAASDPAPPT